MSHGHIGNAIACPLCFTSKAATRIGRITLLLILLLMLSCSHAAGHDTQRHDFQIVATDDGETTKNIVEDLRKKFPSAQVITDATRRRPRTKNTIAIAVGPSSLRSLLSQGTDGIIVSAFTSSQAYRAILDSMPESRTAAITAVYAEPSPAIQFQLIALLYKRPISVAAILSNKTSYLEPILLRAAAQTRIRLTIENFAIGENLNRVLNRLADVQVLLATPDSTVYNPENIRDILVTTYRKNQSVIGFSAALVKAGALASSYSDVDDINTQVDELVSEIEVSGKLPEPQWPKYFGVAVNDDVARSLNFVIDDSVRNFGQKPKVRK